MSYRAKSKPILCLDFDGVLHSYMSGWKGPRCIPDPPIAGALEFLIGALDHFQVAIYSSRSNYFGGRRAMKKWIAEHLWCKDWESCPGWWQKKIATTSFADPWEYEQEWSIKLVLEQIDFPRRKPPAKVTIDDRAIQFRGMWPTLEELQAFKPWRPPCSR